MRQQEPVLVERHVPVQSWQYDQVEFEPLRLVNGHDFDCGGRTAGHEQIFECLADPGRIGHTLLLEFAEPGQSDVGVLQIRGIATAGRTTQRQPCALDPA